MVIFFLSICMNGSSFGNSTTCKWAARISVWKRGASSDTSHWNFPVRPRLTPRNVTDVESDDDTYDGDWKIEMAYSVNTNGYDTIKKVRKQTELQHIQVYCQFVADREGERKLFHFVVLCAVAEHFHRSRSVNNKFLSSPCDTCILDTYIQTHILPCCVWMVRQSKRHFITSQQSQRSHSECFNMDVVRRTYGSCVDTVDGVHTHTHICASN